MNVDLSARIFAPRQQINVPGGNQAASNQTGAAGFMTVLSTVEDGAGTVETGDASWVPWTEEELANLAAQGVPEWEIQTIREQTFPEVAAERWMRIIAPFLNEARLPDAKMEYLVAGRAKCPFLDWVLSGKDPVEFFRQPGKLSTPLHQVTDGSTPALITAVGSPVMLTAATPRDSTTTESRRSAGQALPESVSRFLVTAPQPDGVSSPKTREVPSPGTGPDDRLEQPVAQDAVLPDKGTGSGVKPSVAAARDVETGVAQLSSREAESPARMPATTFAGSLREAVEAPRAQQPPGSKAVLVPSTAPGPSEAQHSASGVRAPAAPVVAQNAELFMSELAERIQVQVRQGGNDIRIQLKPANLGHVEIMAQTGAEGVVARIVTESAAVKQYLENNLHVLEQALVDRGLRMDRIDVVAQGYLDARQSSAQPDSQYGGSGHRADVRGREAALAAGTVPGEDALADSTFRAAIGPHSTFHTVA